MFKRIIAINDLCGLGHSSLAVALPVLSTMGNQVLPAPTAVLSSQTDGFTDYTNVDLTDTLPAYLSHWQAVGVQADALYSGYLGSSEQISDVRYAIDHLTKDNALILIDPVLGDGGMLYDTMTDEMVAAMRELARSAGIITPNATELRALCGLPLDDALSADDLRQAMIALSETGPHWVVTTSFAESSEELTTACYDRHTGAFTLHRQRRLPAHYPGTGDLFASVLLGKLLAGAPIADAARTAGIFIAKAIARAMQLNVPPREGVPFESLLKELI